MAPGAMTRTITLPQVANTYTLARSYTRCGDAEAARAETFDEANINTARDILIYRHYIVFRRLAADVI